ncbi:PREDICTED: probable disease resistance [Prunus dulcis]|uniref:PREDICTED: probable disease resistance n=1 Tax=Prunus dulcis TaxID=3755 RepID=A0A5E4FHE5_PRUDU|nr:PREDICTED: probable disease resistance [Prunus dulcis]
MVTVTLDVLLRELKRKLLKDKASTLVLIGPRGCGKTTLVKKICQDKEVKDIFKKSIFFVRVSKRPNLSVIVRKLYQQIEHKGSQILELQEDIIALKWLQVFLKETGQHPSLLVLDDVWRGSELILDKFDHFKTSYYKILMTSRSEFRTFGSPYYLQSINDEGTMTLFHHSRANSFESFDNEDLVSVSPATSSTTMDDDPTTYFCDFSTSYLEDRISHVSEDANPMAHFHDSFASTTGNTSSSISKDNLRRLCLEAQDQVSEDDLFWE